MNLKTQSGKPKSGDEKSRLHQLAFHSRFAGSHAHGGRREQKTKAPEEF